MQDYFLRFTDEQSSIDALTAEKAVNEDGEIISASHDFAIDVVGIIHKPTGKTLTTEDGIEFPEMAPIDGWHINVRMLNGELPESLRPFAVAPSAPARVFA